MVGKNETRAGKYEKKKLYNIYYSFMTEHNEKKENVKKKMLVVSLNSS